MSTPETLCTGCGATVTQYFNRHIGNWSYRDVGGSSFCANGDFHSIALPPVAIKPEKQSAHTPGPFRVEFGQSPDDFIVTEPTGRTLCEPNEPLFSNSDLAKFDPSLRSISREEAIANAYLFSAAPDMLSALKAIAAWYEKHGWNGNGPSGCALLFDDDRTLGVHIRAAISKAEDFMEEARRTR